MYNPDDIQQARRDMREQRQLGPSEAQVLRDELSAAAEVNDGDAARLADSFTMQRKIAVLGRHQTYARKRGITFKVVSRKIFIDEDGDQSESVTYSPFSNDEIDHLIDATEPAKWQRRDPLRGKIQKFADWDENAPLEEVPTNITLVHEFRSEKKIHCQGNDFFIEQTEHRKSVFYKLVIAESEDFQARTIGEAVKLAIDEDKEFAERAAASKKLNT